MAAILRRGSGTSASGMAKRSSYQQRVIKDYYKNRDAIMLQRLGELVGELYLAEGPARSRLWKRIAGALQNLKVPNQRVEHVVQSDNPALVANLIKELMARG
jgi:hypothetical protein